MVVRVFNPTLVIALTLGTALLVQAGVFSIQAAEVPIPAFSALAENNPQLRPTLTAAHSGDAKAQAKLGDFLFAQSDFTNAVIWYRKAAEQGDSGAQVSLASCYAQGRGVARNPQEAAKWSRRTAVQVGEVKTSFSSLAIALLPATKALPVSAREREPVSPIVVVAAKAALPAEPRVQRIATLRAISPEIQEVTSVVRPYF